MAQQLPEWLLEAQRSARAGDKRRALDLLETYAGRAEYKNARGAATRLTEEVLRTKPSRAKWDDVGVKWIRRLNRDGDPEGDFDEWADDEALFEQAAGEADKFARASEAAEQEKAAAAAEATWRRAAQKAAAARKVARQNKRARKLVELGLPKERAEALAVLRNGPYDVVLRGARSSHSPDDLCAVLKELGYRKWQALQVIQRSMHMNAPQVVAPKVCEAHAIRLKVTLENAGARVRIQPHGTTR